MWQTAGKHMALGARLPDSAIDLLCLLGDPLSLWVLVPSLEKGVVGQGELEAVSRAMIL